jgi:prepilin-type N-terminal cleavage/methylation domain-containing protein
VGQRRHAIHRSDSGFTLTELLIVIVILGVLTGIVVFAVGQFSNRGELAACRTAMKTTEVAVETYRANLGTLPPDMAALFPLYLRTDPSLPTQYDITYDRDGADNVLNNADDGSVTGTLTPGGAC